MSEQTTEKAHVTATEAEAIYDTLDSLARDFERNRDMLRRRARGETKADSMDRREANTWDVAASHLRGAVRDLRGQVTPAIEPDVYVVTTPQGFTETFDRHVIDLLERLGLIRHERDGHVLEDGSGRGVGPLHRFYREVILPPGTKAGA